jgi:hypothetical protein
MIVVSPFHRLATAQGLPPIDACALNIGPVGASSCETAVSLLAWYKADSLALADGAPVASWADSSGNGHTATQATAGKRPVFASTSIPGGGPIVRFQDVNDGLNLAAIVNVRVNYSFYFLTRYTPGQGTFGAMIQAQSGLGGFIFQPDDAPGSTVDIFFAGNPFNVGPAAHCGWQVLTVTADDTSGRLKTYRNGVVIQDQAYNNGVQTDSTWVLGASAAGSDGFVFDLAEVQLYTAAHSAADVLTRSQCLRSRWNIKNSQGV